MPETVWQGDVFVNGNFRSATGTPSANSVNNASVQNGANIDADKLEHRHEASFAQPNTTATSETRVIFRCYGTTGQIIAFHAGSIAINAGAATVTVDLRKNGVSVLTAPITLNNANTARIAVAGTLATTTLALGDILEVVTVATAGGGTLATGVFAFAVADTLPS